MKEERGIPGVSIAVSVDGKTVWSEGFGFADVENRVLCTSKTVMRIASISKPLTTTAAGLWLSQGEGILMGILGRDVPSGYPNSDYISTTKCHFQQQFSNLASKIHTYFQT